MTVQTLDLNMIPGGVLPVVKVSQYDFGLENLVFTLYDGDVAFSMPEDATVQIQGTKPDKNGFAYSCTYSNNVVTASIDQQMTVLAGQVPSEIIVFDDSNNRIASGNFILEVEAAAVSADTPISETDIPAIIELATQQLQTCIQKAQDAADSAGAAYTSETNAANSAGNAHTSETNAATSAGNAYTSETNAATSAGNAHTSETNAGNSATAAHNSEVAAKISEDNAKDYMDDAHGWCDNKGDSGQNTYSATNNAYYWAQQAQNIKDTTPTENSVHAITSGAIFEIINDGVCPIETSTTATRAYAIGDYLQIANVTYKATAAITIGDTLTTGTNIETVALGDEIKEVTQKVSDDSDVYDATLTYDVGDIRIHDNVLYKCNTPITTPEAFDSTKWDATTVSTELTSINTDLSEVQDDLGSTDISSIGDGTVTGAISTINNGLSDICVISENITLSSAVAANSVLAGAGSYPTPENAAVLFGINPSTGGFAKLYTTQTGRLCSGEPMAAGTWWINGSYLVYDHS